MRIFYYNHLSKNQRILTKYCLEYFVNKFLSRLKNKIKIRVIGHKTLVQKENILADCVQDTFDDSMIPRQFIIRIDSSMSITNYFRTLCHELVHVKQLAKGEMRYSARECNKVYWHKKLMKMCDDSYYDHPWEIEAHGRELGMMIGIIETISENDLTKLELNYFDPSDFYYVL